MKKILCLALAFVMVFALCACSQKTVVDNVEVVPEQNIELASQHEEVEIKIEKPLKVGLITLHDENSTYDLNFINAFKEACEAENVEYVIKTGAGEDNTCYEAACDLADGGCDVIFADSFGHEDYMIMAAQEYPEVEFCHATGTQAHTLGLPNFHNAFASIYEGRFLDGIAVGMKLNEMDCDPFVGYVGAHPYAEVISGYTSFFLGVRSVCPDARMEVTFTGSWYDETLEKEAATKLINDGCTIISGHADSMGSPTACESAGVPFAFYNGSVVEACPNTFIVSTRINWVPYFKYMIENTPTHTIATDWTGTIETGSVVMTEVNDKVAAPGTAEAINKAIEQFKKGYIKVFDTSAFTVDGKNLESYMADVDSDENYTPDTEVILDGWFHESEFRSAPYFDIDIDGITRIG